MKRASHKIYTPIIFIFLILFVFFPCYPTFASSIKDSESNDSSSNNTIEIKDNFEGIIAPGSIMHIKNGTSKSAKALGLPEKVTIQSWKGYRSIKISWDVKNAKYDPKYKEEQSFQVKGTITLPSDMMNIENIPLSTNIEVNVAGAGYKFSFLSISDLHINSASTLESDVPQKDNLIHALDDAKLFKCSAITVVGDMTQSGKEKEYENLQEIMKVGTDLPYYYVMGNHDSRWQDSFEAATNRFAEKTGMPVTPSKPYYDKWINGYHFIFLCTESDNQDIAYLSDTQLGWLDEKLGEKAKTDKPIFVFLHQPISQTLPPKYINGVSGSDEVQDQKILEILGKYPQSILISGHIHNEITGSATLYNSKFCTMLRDGCAGPGQSDNPLLPEGLMIEVYGDKVIVKGRNFYNKQTIWSTVIHNYTKERLKEDKLPPSAPQKLSIKHKTDSSIVLNWVDSKDDFMEKYNNVGLAGYEVYDDDILIGSTNGSNRFLVTDLKPNTRHVFTVRAKDLAGNRSEESNKLVLSTLFSNDAPTNLALNKKVTASSIEKEYDAANAVDGDITTKWSSKITKEVDWVMVDLGARYDISRWVVKNSNGIQEIPSKYPKNYRLMGSLDGTNWFMLDEVHGNVLKITDRYFKRTEVRYLKVYYDTPSNYKATTSAKENANLYELEIYGANILKDYNNHILIGQLPNKVSKTQEGLNLPARIPIETSKGKIWAKVLWNIDDANYQEGLRKPQTFTVRGILTLPEDVINPDGIPLNMNVDISVSKEELSKVILTSKSKLNMGEKQQTNLKALLKDKNIASLSTSFIEYTSSNPKVVTIDKNGLIAAKSVGKATIQATVKLNGRIIKSNKVQIIIQQP